jgi:LPXTG-site transpeptidase (sortase) family protein
MAPPRLTGRAVLLAALLALLGGCTTAPPAPVALDAAAEPTLPPPALLVEALPLPEPVPPDEIPPVIDTELFSEALPDLADAVHGERLIEWIRIDAINVYAPVTPVGWAVGGSLDNPEAVEWDSPGAGVGWVIDSALPGDESGSVILYGHNNINSSVFRDLADLAAGDRVALSNAQGEWIYEVSEVHILPVSGTSGERAEYAQHLLPGLAPRLVLISCWPPDNNTHRVIVVGYLTFGSETVGSW